MKEKLILILIAITAVVILSGCSLLPRSRKDLDGTAWVLESYGGKAPLPGSTMTAVFEDGQVSGSASCNHYFADYQASGGRIEIEGLGWTEMACLNPEGVMEQEREIMSFLGSSATYQIQGTRLVLKTGSGQQLVFSTLENQR